MTSLQKLIVLFAMIWLHIADDFYLQGLFSKLKQKSWWKENEYHSMYEHDYVVALLEHAFSWSFAIMIPVFITCWMNLINPSVVPVCIIMITNVVIHATVDNLKANEFKINLITDQLVHIVQVTVTWMLFFL